MAEIIRLAGCIIADDEDRILLIHRVDPKQWEIPGGKIEGSETADQAAIREAHEELGVTVGLMGLLAVTEFTSAGNRFEQTIYLADVILGKPKPMEAKHDMTTFQDVKNRDSCNGSIFSDGYAALCELIHAGKVNLNRNKK